MPVICSLFFLSSYSYENCVCSEMFVRYLVLEDVRLWLPPFSRHGTLYHWAGSALKPQLSLLESYRCWICVLQPFYQGEVKCSLCKIADTCILLTERPWHIQALVGDPVSNPARWVLHQPSPAPGALDAPLSSDCQASQNLADCCLQH